MSTGIVCPVRVVRHSEILQQVRGHTVLPLRSSSLFPKCILIVQNAGFAEDFRRCLLCTLVIVAPLPSLAPAHRALLHKQERHFLSTAAPVTGVFPACKKPGYRSGWVLYPSVAKGLVF